MTRREWILIGIIAVLVVVMVIGYVSERHDRTALEAKVDALLASAPAWRDSLAQWQADTARLNADNRALKDERDAYKTEAARWHVIADAHDSSVVATRPLAQQVTYWHDKYLASTREQMATAAALATETRRADSLEKRALTAESRIVGMGKRLDSVTVTLDSLYRSQECRINLVVTHLKCPSRAVSFVGGAGTVLVIRALLASPTK